MKFKYIFNKWRFIGHNEYTVNKYHLELCRENLKMLRYLGIISCTVSIFAGIFHVAVNDYPWKVFLLIFFGIFMFTVSLLSKRMYCGEIDFSVKMVNYLLDFASFCAYVQGIAFGTFGSNNELAVSEIWLFLLVQIVFNRLPLENKIVIPSALLFIFCSFITKDAVHTVYDALHSITVLVIGMFIAWNKTKLRIDCLISDAELKEKNEKLYYISTIDALTGLDNRKYIFEKLEKVKRECRNEKCRMFCIVMDVDNFKAYNDLYGHPAGDELLKKIGQALISYCVPRNICVGRIGGEEFLAVWKNNDDIDPRKAADEIRMLISDMKIPHKGSITADVVTISQGLYMTDKVEDENPYSLADQALYEAKRRGKNRCCVA